MTATAELTDVDVDLAREVACVAVSGCNRSADWLGVLRHPDRQVCTSRTLCDTHRRDYIAWRNNILATRKRPYCHAHDQFLDDEWIAL